MVFFPFTPVLNFLNSTFCIKNVAFDYELLLYWSGHLPTALLFLLLLLPWSCVWCEPSRGQPLGLGGRGWRASAVFQLAGSWEPCLWAKTLLKAGGWTSWAPGVTLHPAERAQSTDKCCIVCSIRCSYNRLFLPKIHSKYTKSDLIFYINNYVYIYEYIANSQNTVQY